MRQEQQEKSLLFMVVVGYIVTFAVASNGGTRSSITRLLMGIIFGVVYLIPGFFETTEVLQRFSAKYEERYFFPNSSRDGFRHRLDFGTRWQLVNRTFTGRIPVESLSARSDGLVYAGLLAAIVLPILRFSTWDIAMMNAFIISTATML